MSLLPRDPLKGGFSLGCWLVCLLESRLPYRSRPSSILQAKGPWTMEWMRVLYLAGTPPFLGSPLRAHTHLAPRSTELKIRLTAEHWRIWDLGLSCLTLPCAFYLTSFKQTLTFVFLAARQWLERGSQTSLKRKPTIEIAPQSDV